MRAAVFVGPGRDLELHDLELDPPRHDEVRVEISGCAICQSDMSFFDGHWQSEAPAVFGHEAVGRVVDVGSAVTSVVPGDTVSVSLVRSCGTCRYCARGESVCCDGLAPRPSSPLKFSDGRPVAQGLGVAGFAEAAVVHQSQVVPIGDDLSVAAAALLGCGAITGYGAVVNTARVAAGSTVVVIGCGGVGLNAIQAARVSGASVIVGVDVEATKLDVARAVGATHVIDPADGSAASAVRSLNGDRLADHVLVTVGSKAALESAFALLAPGGTAVLVGMTADGVTIDLDATTLVALNQKILGSKMGAATVARDVPVLVDLFRRGEWRLDELVSDSFPLERINEAVAATRRGDVGRVVVTMGA